MGCNLICKCLLVGGVLSLIYFFILLYFTRRAKKWPTTIGQVLFSEISTSGLDVEVYKAVIKYKYQVQGKIYVSNRLSYGCDIAISSLSYAQKKVKQYFVGSTCTVYYNPHKPQISVLEISLKLPLFIVLFSGILLILLGGMLLLAQE